jgi:hypothetical protein
MKKLLVITTALTALATPAHAAPVAAAFAWIGATLAAGGIAGAALQMAISFGLSAIAGAIFKPKGPKQEVNFDVQMGDDLPLSFVVGDYATAGKRKYIGTWGRNTRFVTEVIEYSALPQGLETLWVNDEEAIFEANRRAFISTGISPSGVQGWTEGASVPGSAIDIGQPLRNLRDDGNRITVKIIPGTQTAADPFLVRVFGDDPDYPIGEDFIGRGKSYVIITTRYDSDTLTSYPTFLLQPAPLPMYDWRLDSTNGGSGAHRWGNRSTYAPTRNPAIIAYNIIRGIYYGSEWVYGGKNNDSWRLPLAEWTAAANACDQIVNVSGGTEPRYRCGLEIRVADEPASVLEEIGKAANMRFAEVGGRIKPIVDLPGAAVFSFTDADILITEGQSFKPFFPVSDTYNAITATYPERGQKWASKDAPEYVDSAASEDDGRYLPIGMTYGAVPFRRQVQRLMRSQMKDFRRMRRHTFHLPPDAYALEPGIDRVVWNSERNGYNNKAFLVESVIKLPGMNVAVTLREINPADYDWSSDFEQPVIITPPVNPPVVYLPSSGFGAEPYEIRDAADNARRPAIRAFYIEDDPAGIRQIHIQGRIVGRPLSIDNLQPFEPQSWIYEALPGELYQVRGRLIYNTGPRGAWSDWIEVRTPDVGFTWYDWDQNLRAEIEAALGLIPVAIENANQVRLQADQISAMLAESARRLWEELNAVRDGALEGQFGEFLARQTMRSELLVEVGNARASFADQIDVIITEQAALSLRATSLQSQFESTTAAYGQDLITLADGQRALAGSMQEFQTQVATSNAQVIQQIGALSQAQQSTASRLDQVSAAVGTTGATAGTLATAIAEIQGALRAGYLIRAQAGGAASSIELIAADGSGGRPTSIVRLSGDEILLDGSVSMQKLAITGTRTLVHDPEYRALDSWFGAPPRTVVTTSNLDFWGGPRVLSLTAEANVRSRIISAKVPVEPRQTVRADVPISATNSSRQGSIRLMFYATSGQSMGSPTATVAAPDATSAQQVVSVEAVVPAGCAFMALEYFTPSASGTNSVRFGYPLLRILDAYNLIISGGAVADFITTRDLAALNARFSDLAAARIRVGDAEIDTLQIAGNAVTVQWSSNSFGLNINVPHPTKIMVFTSARIMGTFQTHNTRYSLRRNGTEIDSVVFSVDEYTNPYLQMRAFSIPAGQHQFEFDYTRVSGSSTTTNYNTGRIAIFGAFR